MHNSPSRLDEFRQCAAEGLTVVETKTRLGVSHQRVYQIAKKHGLRFRPAKPDFNIVRLRELAQSGASAAEAAAELGVSINTVYTKARELGAKFRKPNKHTTATESAVLADIRKGCLQTEIADRHGVSQRYVSAVGMKNGIR